MSPFKCCQLYHQSKFKLMPVLRLIWDADAADDPAATLEQAIQLLQDEVEHYRARLALNTGAEK